MFCGNGRTTKPWNISGVRFGMRWTKNGLSICTVKETVQSCENRSGKKRKWLIGFTFCCGTGESLSKWRPLRYLRCPSPYLVHHQWLEGSNRLGDEAEAVLRWCGVSPRFGGQDHMTTDLIKSRILRIVLSSLLSGRYVSGHVWIWGKQERQRQTLRSVQSLER